MALAGRLGDEAENYLKHHPQFGRLLRTIANQKPSRDELIELTVVACNQKRSSSGADYKMLHRLCAGDAETLDLLAQASRSRKRGGDRRSESFKVDDGNFEPTKKGNSVEYALKRLRRQRPDLHRQVIEGKLSVNRAMIVASYRKRPLPISRDLNKTAAVLRTVFSSSHGTTGYTFAGVL